tara:strand:+ start:600 stop:947 length:348 start_codon:yes stop_codon:yes gene_type:complete
MKNLYYKVKVYLENNSKTANFLTEIVLENNGSGDYISKWNVDGLAKPTDEQLNALESEATKLENNNKVRTTRKQSYGDIGDQLDLLYKDMLAGKGDKTGEWFKAVKKVKDDNPKS